MKIKNTIDFGIAERKVRAALGSYADTAAKKMEGYAKSNRPWTDRTSNAKNSIQGKHHWRGKDLVIILSGNVDYFVFLELAHGKNYAILKPTVDKFGPEVFRGYQKLVR